MSPNLDASDFLSLLFHDVASGWLEITYLAPEGVTVDRMTYRDPEGGVHRAKTVVGWRPLPLGSIDPNMPKLHTMNGRGYSVYFGVTVRRVRKQAEWRTKEDGTRYWSQFPRGTQKDAQYITALWADADAKDYGGDLDEARHRIEALHPTITTFTGGGYQGYLLLDQPLEITDANRADVKRTLQGIAKAIGSDPSVAELARIMRLPGTVNTKPGRNGAVCEVVAANDQRYTFADLFTAYAPFISVKKKSSATTHYEATDDQQAEVIEALRHIPVDSIPYLDWITILAGLNHNLGSGAAQSVAEQWDGGYSRPGEIAAKIASFDNSGSTSPATLGSVFHIAKQFGYVRPAHGPALRVVRQTLPPNLPEVTGTQVFAAGLPDSFRSAWLNIEPCAGYVLEVITDGSRAGHLNPSQIDFGAVLRANLALGWGASESTLRRGFNALKKGFLSDLHTEKNPKDSVCKIENNPVGGRSAEVYTMPTIDQQQRAILEMAAPGLYELAHPVHDNGDRPAIVADVSARQLAALGIEDEAAKQIAAEINALSKPAYEKQADLRRKAGKRARLLYTRLESALKNTHSTPLPTDWIPRDVSSYRASLLRAWMDEDADRLRSRREIAAALGIAQRSVDTYLEKAGIESLGDQFEQHPITSTTNIEREVTRLAYELKGKPMRIVACTTKGQTIEAPYSSEAIGEFVPVQQAAGASVFVRFQVANRHTIDPNASPATPAVRRPAPKRTEAEQERQPRAVAPTPAEQNYLPGGYRPQWVRDQLALRLHVMGWVHEGKFMNPNTGEILYVSASAFELIGLMVGRQIGSAVPDPLIELAESLGAVIKVLA